MLYRLFFLFSYFLLFIGFLKPAFGQKSKRYEIGIQNDNDAFLLIGQDRYYTNGINVFFKKAINPSKFSEKLENKNWSISIGQKIYNAHSGSVIIESQVDRPLTGYLFASGEVRWFFKNEDVFSIGTELAAIGPMAYGKEIQEWFHSIFSFYDIKGWEYQLNDAVGVDFRADYSRFLFRSQTEKWDGFMSAKLSLGSNNTSISSGPMIRYGRMNRMFESTIMGGRISSKNNKPKNESFLYYQPQINWVLYNSTIQGGMFIENKGPIVYDVKPLFLSQVVGVQWNYERVGLNFNYTFNTNEVRSTAVPHQYGSLRLSYYF